jgi:hypothetical protein
MALTALQGPIFERMADNDPPIKLVDSCQEELAGSANGARRHAAARAAFGRARRRR